MQKALLGSALVIALSIAALAGIAFADNHEQSWTGEVIDLACYVAHGAKGPDHSDCAQACVASGQPMGLLTDDGTLVLLAADSKNEAAYESLKKMAGTRATISGSLAERDGMKVVKVLGSKAAV